RSATATASPSRASRSAIPLPIPRAAPVTMAVRWSVLVMGRASEASRHGRVLESPYPVNERLTPHACGPTTQRGLSQEGFHRRPKDSRRVPSTKRPVHVVLGVGRVVPNESRLNPRHHKVHATTSKIHKGLGLGLVPTS